MNAIIYGMLVWLMCFWISDFGDDSKYPSSFTRTQVVPTIQFPGSWLISANAGWWLIFFFHIHMNAAVAAATDDEK